MPKATFLRTSSLFTALAVSALVNVPGARAELSISDAWVRAMPPTQTMTAGYATITNNGPATIIITGASSDIAPLATLHTTVQEGERLSMVALPSIELAPGEQFNFAPAGAHIMLMQIRSMPAPGSVAELCFSIDNSAASCAQATVQRNPPAAQNKPSQDIHHGHHSDHGGR